MLQPRFHVFACLMLAASCAGAAEHGALVDALYRESGMEQQIEGIPGQIVQGLSEGFASGGSGLGLDPEGVLLLADQVEKAFDAKAMGVAIRDEIARELTDDDIEQVLRWLRSPLGQRFTRMEEDASTSEAYADMVAYGRGLKDDPPENRRLVRIDELLGAMNGTEAAVSMALSTQMAVVTAMVAATPGNGPEDLSSAIMGIEQARPEITRMMQGEVLVASLFTYRGASDEELARYAAFARTGPGQRYHEVTFRSLERAMVQASQRLGLGVIEALSDSAA